MYTKLSKKRGFNKWCIYLENKVGVYFKKQNRNQWVKRQFFELNFFQVLVCIGVLGGILFALGKVLPALQYLE